MFPKFQLAFIFLLTLYPVFAKKITHSFIARRMCVHFCLVKFVCACSGFFVSKIIWLSDNLLATILPAWDVTLCARGFGFPVDEVHQDCLWSVESILSLIILSIHFTPVGWTLSFVMKSLYVLPGCTLFTEWKAPSSISEGFEGRSRPLIGGCSVTKPSFFH